MDSISVYLDEEGAWLFHSPLSKRSKLGQVSVLVFWGPVNGMAQFESLIVDFLGDGGADGS